MQTRRLAIEQVAANHAIGFTTATRFIPYNWQAIEGENAGRSCQTCGIARGQPGNSSSTLGVEHACIACVIKTVRRRVENDRAAGFYCAACDAPFDRTREDAVPYCSRHPIPPLRPLVPSRLPVSLSGEPLAPCVFCALYQPPARILRTLPIALCLDCTTLDHRLIYAVGQQARELHVKLGLPGSDVQAAWKLATDGRSCRACHRAGELMTRIASEVRRDRTIGVEGECIGCVVTAALRLARATPAASATQTARRGRQSRYPADVRAAKAAEAQRLKAEGRTWPQIGAKLGLSPSTIHRWWQTGGS